MAKLPAEARLDRAIAHYNDGKWHLAIEGIKGILTDLDAVESRREALHFLAACWEALSCEADSDAMALAEMKKAYSAWRQLEAETQASDPRYPDVILGVGKAACNAEDYLSAKKALNMAITISVDAISKSNAQLELADVLVATGQFEDAEALLVSVDLTAVKCHSHFIRLHYLRGRVLSDSGQFEEAQVQFIKALRVHPEGDDPMSVQYVDCAFSLADILRSIDAEEALRVAFLPFEKFDFTDAVGFRLTWLREEIEKDFLGAAIGDKMQAGAFKAKLDSHTHGLLVQLNISEKAIATFENSQR